MTVRKTIQWLVILVGLAAVGGAGYGFVLWNEANERIRTAVLEKCDEIVPDWDVSLGRARFDWNRRVHLYNVIVKAKGGAEPIVEIPEIVVSIDRDRFTQQQEIIVQKVRVLGPVIDLVRGSRGVWNWQRLQPPLASNQSLPEVAVEQATVRLRLEQTDGSPAAVLGLQNANLKLIPSGKRRFLIGGLTQVSQAGKLTIDGSWDIDLRTGWFKGRMNDVASSGELSGLVIGSSPELRLKLARVQAAIDNYRRTLPDELPDRRRDPFLFASLQADNRTASRRDVPLHERPAELEDGVPNLGASGLVDVEFKVAVPAPRTEPTFEFLVDVKQGLIENDALPFPLRDLAGRIFWNNDRLDLINVSAKNGRTRLSLDGRFARQGDAAPGRLDLSLTSLMLDDRLRSRLPASALKIYDSVQPGGLVDLKGSLLFDGLRTWQPRDTLLTFHNCTGRHVKFPLPVEQVTGTIEQRGEEFIVNLQGRTGSRPATLNGWIRNPGPAAETFVTIRVDQLPLDQSFISACRPPMQKAIHALNLKGEASGEVTIRRSPGLDQPLAVDVSARVGRASIDFVHFPYRLANLQGDVGYSSANRTWLFENLTAEHGNARLSGTASFVKQEEPGQLDLTLNAEGTDIDLDLLRALPEPLRETWEQISPGGRLDLVSRISWVPGRPARIALPSARVTKGEMTLKSLPYRLDEVETAWSYEEGQVKIASFTARHDRTKVRTNGVVDWSPAGNWRVRLDELSVEDLLPDRSFRRALQADLRTVVEELDPAGPISFAGTMEFRGVNDPRVPLTAGWDLKSIHTGGKLTTGLDLEKLYGRVSSRGTWDGRRVAMSGEIDLDSVVVKGYQLTQVQGPFEINGDRIFLGSKRLFLPQEDPQRQPPIPPHEHVTARAIGGVLTFDADVRLADDPTYFVKMTMSQGRLEEYARLYMAGAKNLEGKMDGGVDLHGRGASPETMKGRGQLRINPAALYEMPVIVQVVNLIGAPDKTAFRYAFLDFDIANEQFQFKTIDLAGDAFSLRGRGAAGFDGRLDLKFYSMLARNSVPIPIVRTVLGEASKGWVGVNVRGTTSRPQARVTAVPQVDEALKRFLGAFGSGPPVNLPRLLFSPLGPPPQNGRSGRNLPRRTSR